jgi:hypothetical protein
MQKNLNQHDRYCTIPVYVGLALDSNIAHARLQCNIVW